MPVGDHIAHRLALLAQGGSVARREALENRDGVVEQHAACLARPEALQPKAAQPLREHLARETVRDEELAHLTVQAEDIGFFSASGLNS